MIKLNFKKTKIIILTSLLLGGIFFGFLPQAQALQIKNYPSFLNINGITSSDEPLVALISTIFGFLLMIAGLAALIMVVWGGVSYLTSAGDPSKMEDAKDRIFKAILGLVILFSSWMILNTINPQLVVLKEPGTPGATVPKTSVPTVIMGYCAPGTNYAVKLFDKNNPDPSLCFNGGELSTSTSGNIYSVQVEGNVAVKFFDEKKFQGRNLCFKSSYSNIASCLVGACLDNLYCSDAWPNDVGSIKIITPQECQSPGITLQGDGTPTNVNAKCSGF